jgi:tetratricopeptide (TPR) repeat protein
MLSLDDSKKMMRCSPTQSQKLAKVAIKRFNKALALEPAYVDAHFYVAQAYALNSQQKSAQGSLKKLLEINPNHIGAQQMLINQNIINEGSPAVT